MCDSLEPDNSELEREFKETWRYYDPSRIEQFLSRVSEKKRPDLLVRLLSAELDFSFQAPPKPDGSVTKVGTEDDDDDRIRPSLHLFLIRFEELKSDTEAIIRLAVLEYALRLRYDELPPTPDSYLSLVDEDQDRLLKLIQLTETTLPFPRPEVPQEPANPSDSTVRDSKGSQSLTSNPLPHDLGCFLLLGQIGRGGMGFVYSAIDLRNTSQVAVKVMRRIDPWSVIRFHEEFTWLSKLSHPHLVKLYDAYSEGNTRYFSMELVDGNTIRQWFQLFKEDSERRWKKLKRVLGQAASALQFLHQSGVIHCDVKCSNLMIASRERAVLLDLGLAVREDHTSPFVGTIQYMAPEIIAGGHPSKASDWYSFGIMIFEVLTDLYPPVKVELSEDRTDNSYKLDDQKLHEQLQNCDREIADLCCQLLAQTADARPLGKQVLETLGVDGLEIEASSPQSVLFGRSTELQILDEIEQKSLEQSRMLVVHGETGSGKSAIIEHWLANYNRDKALTFALECFRQDHTALRVMHAIVQHLVMELKDPHNASWFPKEANVSYIAAEFPQVHLLFENELETQARAPVSASARSIRYQAVEQLKQWLLEICLHRSLTIVIDGAQWVDDESLRILQELVTQEQFNGFVVLICQDPEPLIELSFDSEQLIVEKLRVDPLENSASIELLNGLADSNQIKLSHAVAENIARRARGSPFLLEEIFGAYMHYANQKGFSDAEWINYDPEQAARQKFSLLPANSETVLQFLAVADQPLSFQQLEMLTRNAPPDLQSTLSSLTSQGWLRSPTSSTDYSVQITNTARQLVLESLPKDRLARRHFRLARMFSSEVPPAWAPMGKHYSAAGYHREAATCYLEAARFAHKSGAHRSALKFVDLAGHAEADRTPSERSAVSRLRADCLAACGQSTSAAQIYMQLCSDEDLTDSDQRELRCLAGEQWIRAGAIAKGSATLRHIMDEEGIFGARLSRLSQFLLRIRALRSALFERPPNVALIKADKEFSTLENCLNRLSFAMSFFDNRLGPELILVLSRRARVKGSLSERAIAMLNMSLLQAVAGNSLRKRAIIWLRGGQQLAKSSADPMAQGWARHCMFIWYVQQGKIATAARHAHAAIDLYAHDPKTLQWETQFLNWAVLGCYWYSGQLKRLTDCILEIRESASDEKEALGMYLNNVASAHQADLVRNDVSGARLAIEEASLAIRGQPFQSPMFFLWLSQVTQALYEQDATSARELLLKNWSQLAKSYIFSSKHYHWIALCLRMCCNLVCLREGIGNSTAILLDSRRSLKKMARLQSPAFLAYGDAFELLLDASVGKIASLSRWNSVSSNLRRHGHALYADALACHSARFGDPHDFEVSTQQGFDKLRNMGIVAPERLLDIILPLPIKSS